jgi:hypothetical protein
VCSCTPDILKYASNLKHAIAKLQVIHTTIKYTTRYSQLGKPQDPRTKKNQGLVRKSATSEVITKKYTVKNKVLKNDEWKTPCMTEYKKRHIHTYHTKIRTYNVKNN